MVYLGTGSDNAAGSNGSSATAGKNGSSPPIVDLDSDSSPPSQQRNGEAGSNGGPVTRDSRDSRGGAEDSGSEGEAEGQIRVGKDYQVNPPPFIPLDERRSDQCQERALLVWSPNLNLPQSKLDEYIQVSKEKYGYNAEQALGMLFWHKHDLDRAIQDLANFTPFPDEWTVEDKVLFEQAFQFHGKSFHRIRQMLPDKTIAQLVKYYYGWKKTRTRTSLMDRQARKLQVQREAGNYNSNGSAETGSTETENKTDQIISDDEEEVSLPSALGSSTASPSGKPKCFNCGILCHVTHATPKGQMCGTCHQYYQRTGNIRPTTTPMRRDGTRGAQKLLKNSSRPPKGMYINHDDLVALATGPNTQGDQILKSMDREIVSYKRVVQHNKQTLSGVMKKPKEKKNLDPYRVPDPASRINARWSNEELLLGVQGVRKFGKNFKVIAEVIGTKTESHVRSFYVNYRRRYNLDSALKEYEAEHGPTPNDDIDLSTAGDSKSGSASRSNSGNNSPSPVAEEVKTEEAKPTVETNGDA